MDSRAYVFIYPLRAKADIPDDFPQEVRTQNFGTGVFLPQDDVLHAAYAKISDFMQERYK